MEPIPLAKSVEREAEINGRTYTRGNIHINCPVCGTGIELTEKGEIKAFVFGG